MTLPNFTQEEIAHLYHQHTEVSGQAFEANAVERAWYWTEGQPRLVNALAYESVVNILGKNYSQPITSDIINQAAENLILRRDINIDYLLERLKESMVKRVIEPVILGDEDWDEETTDDDIRYAQDLELIKQDGDTYRPTNPIYSEVIIRTLTQRLERRIPIELVNRWMDGSKLDMTGLLLEFQQFWRENAESLVTPYKYTQASPYLVGFAFLQRVLNGQARFISREYSLGFRRVDILVKYNQIPYPLEFKIKNQYFNAKKRDESLERLRSYIAQCGAKEGWSLIFEPTPNKNWEDKLYWETIEIEGVTIHVVGC
ncbi:MAG: hypothetical protein LBT86_07915 [Deltaproteobacteria bacterium]|nr:hypothetical protein [Deltaproteobacteria bacterium]